MDGILGTLIASGEAWEETVQPPLTSRQRVFNPNASRLLATGSGSNGPRP